jgi:flagellar biosynthesis protein FlhF
MQIKRFKAADMSTALKMVKQEFGPEAVILSVRDLEKGKGLFGMMDRGGLEVTAAMDTPFSETKPRAEENVRRPPYAGPPPVSVTLSGTGKKRSAAPKRKSAPGVPPAPPVPEFPEFFRQLIDQDVNERIALEIVGKIGNMANGAHSLPDRLAQGMTRILREKGIKPLGLDPKPGKQRLVSFMGPAGVGKTTTIAKLSGFHSIRGRDIGIIALDDDRICALRKLEIYARIINVPMELATGNDGMQRALRRFRNKAIVYVDTPGASFGKDQTIRRIRKKLSATPGIQNQLLISAAAKEKDIAGWVRRFKSIPIHGLIVTKLDESLTYGNLLNHLYQAPMPLSYFTDGHQVPEDIRPASPQMLAGLFVREEEAETAPAAPPVVSPADSQDDPPEGEEGDLDIEDQYEGLRYYGGRM